MINGYWLWLRSAPQDKQVQQWLSQIKAGQEFKTLRVEIGIHKYSVSSQITFGKVLCQDYVSCTPLQYPIQGNEHLIGETVKKTRRQKPVTKLSSWHQNAIKCLWLNWRTELLTYSAHAFLLGVRKGEWWSSTSRTPRYQWWWWRWLLASPSYSMVVSAS